MATQEHHKNTIAVYIDARRALDVMRTPPSRRRTLVLDQGVLRVTWYTPQQITTVHTLRQQGCTYPQICARTGWSYSAVRYMRGMRLADPGDRLEAAAALADTTPSTMKDMMNPTAVYIEALRALDVMEKEVQDGFETGFWRSNLARIRDEGADRVTFSAKDQACIRTLVETYFSPERAAELFYAQERLL